jgi:hypothetical protein
LTGGTTVLITGSVPVTAAGVEFNGPVTSGLVFQVEGYSVVTIDNARSLHGEIELRSGSGVPKLDLAGMSDADHWSYRNDILKIFDADNRVVDTLHLVSDAFPGGVGTGGLSLTILEGGEVTITLGSDFSGNTKAV